MSTDTKSETRRRISESELREQWEREHNVGPGMTMVCGSPMFSPTAKPDLSDELWEELLTMQGADEVGNDVVIAFIARAEAHMGTTEMHRIGARESAGMLTREEAEEARRVVRARISSDKRRRLLDANRRAAALDEPMRDPEYVLKIAKAETRLRDAQVELDQLRAGDPKKNRKAIKRGENRIHDLAKKLSTLQAVELEAYSLMGEAREPILRAMQRGETIQAKVAETADIARDEHGARIINRGGPERGLPALVYSRGLRARNLTGLEHALWSGYLGDGPEAERRAATGRHFGECFEIVKGLTSNRNEGGGGSGFGAGPQLRVFEAGQDYADFCAGLSERQKDALDYVCGKSMRVSQAAAAMRSDARTVRRLLVSGLDEAGRSLAMERGKRSERAMAA